MISELLNDKFTLHFPATTRHYLKASYIFANNLLHKKPKNNFIQFLYGHYLFSDEIRNFYKITDYLNSEYKIISYSEAIDRVKNGLIDDKYICFSFDDGILNCLRIAEHFHRMGISAMFFINPHIAENTQKPGCMKLHCNNRLEMLEVDFMSWKEISALQKMNHEIGNHTYSHKDLGRISPAEYAEEILESKSLLECHVGKVKHFAWPYGRRINITPEAFKLVKSCHDSVASAIRGQHFESLDLETNFILRDQVVFKEPLWFLQYFISRNQNKMRLTQL